MTDNGCSAICTGHMTNSRDISVSQIKAVRGLISVVWAGRAVNSWQGGQQGYWRSDSKFDRRFDKKSGRKFDRKIN